ncbi:MAG: type III-B CRISPR module RAMP protein Cmr6 [Gammaproteobacteria bacterium]
MTENGYSPPCREALLELPRKEASHAGLVLSRYLGAGLSDKANENDARQAVLKKAKAAARQTIKGNLYKAAFERRSQWLEQLPALKQDSFQVQGRFVTGLGNASPLEVGLTLHHTYGVPVIPGSSLKGLCAHFCHRVLGATDPTYKISGKKAAESTEATDSTTSAADTLFGNTDEAGIVVFHDAWIMPDSLQQGGGLVLDVMTPHHQDYYSSNGKSPPSDFDDPNPVTFLSSTGHFHIALHCLADDEDIGRSWTTLAFQILSAALQHWGAGAKTRSGYGRMLQVQQQPRE